jgi:hypothetical protein
VAPSVSAWARLRPVAASPARGRLPPGPARATGRRSPHGGRREKAAIRLSPADEVIRRHAEPRTNPVGRTAPAKPAPISAFTARRLDASSRPGADVVSRRLVPVPSSSEAS